MEKTKLPCVYFIHAEGTDLVKVGWTADLDRRFDQLQTASPHRLRLLGVHIGLKDVERVYHRDLQPYRQRGEWFFLTPEVRRWLSVCLNRHSESHSLFFHFHLNRVHDEDAAREQLKWQESLESFMGIPGSQPSRMDDPALTQAFFSMLESGSRHAFDESEMEDSQ